MAAAQCVARVAGSGGGCAAAPASHSQWRQGEQGVSFCLLKRAGSAAPWPRRGRVVAAAPPEGGAGPAQVVHPQEKAALAAAAEAALRAHKNDPEADAEKHLQAPEEVIASDAKLLVHTYARAPVVLVSGKGCNVYDADGKEYLDLAAGIAVNSLGHSDPAWVKAVVDQAGLLAHTSNLYHTVPQVKLAKRLVEASFADRVFFSNSGTEANEAAIKFARKFQRVKAQEREDARWLKLPFGQASPATGFVAYSGGFHGRTLGALALTSKAQYRAPFEPIMPGVTFIDFGDLEATRKAVRGGSIAGVFVEPVQGEGGVLPAVATFLRGLRKLCDDEGVLLIFDEVQCGLGRTGRLWAHESYGVQPDIMTLAKPLAGGLPIGAVLVTEAVAAAIQPGDHGSTFAGGPLVCTAALAVMDRLQEPGFLEAVASKGHFLKTRLQEVVGGNRHVKEVRGTGLLVGLQLDVPAGPLVDAAREQGLLVITAGKGDVVRMAPPLTISELELEKAVSILAKCLPSLG